MRALSARAAVLATFIEMLRAWNLETVGQLEHGLQDWIAFRDVDNRPVRKYQADALQEHLPFVVAMKIVRHEEAAAQQIFAHHFGFLFGQSPLAHLHRVEPRPVVRLVSVLKHHGLFDGPHLNARQTPDGLREMPVGARIILGPERQPLPEVAIETSTVAVVRPGRIHQPRERPLALVLPVGRQLEAEIFDAGVLFEWPLESVERADENESASQPTRRFSHIHPLPYPENSIRGVRANARTPGSRLIYCVREQVRGCDSGIRSPLGAHRRFSRLDTGRFRFLPGHVLPNRDRQGVPQIGFRDRAVHYRDARISSRGGVHIWIARGPLWPQASADDRPGLLFGNRGAHWARAQLHYLPGAARAVWYRHGRRMGRWRIARHGESSAAAARPAVRVVAGGL